MEMAGSARCRNRPVTSRIRERAEAEVTEVERSGSTGRPAGGVYSRKVKFLENAAA
jgi:hypothetical protein